VTLFQDDGTRVFREPPHAPEQRKPGRRLAIAMTILAVVSAGLLALTALPSNPLSWLTHYSMSAELGAVADRIGFTDEGLAIFTSTEPELLTDAPFREACDDDEDSDDGEGSTVGCYYGIGDTGRIAIFQPSDPRLADQVAVTVAHEFLHAAYERIAPADRERLDELLDARWAELPENDPMRQTLELSVGENTDAQGTEEFAYLGSELADAGPELETYYAPYFRDRQAVVAFDAADDALWAGVDADYQAALDALTTADDAVAAETAELASGRITDPVQRSEAQAALTARQAEVDALQTELDRLDADYDALIDASLPG
jgi:hypothetical protein